MWGAVLQHEPPQFGELGDALGATEAAIAGGIDAAFDRPGYFRRRHDVALRRHAGRAVTNPMSHVHELAQQEGALEHHS